MLSNCFVLDPDPDALSLNASTAAAVTAATGLGAVGAVVFATRYPRPANPKRATASISNGDGCF